MVAQLDNAMTACEQALQTGVGLADACRTLGYLLQSMGWFREAVIWQSRSVERRIKPVRLYTDLGALRAKQRRWPEAIATYQQALQIDANDAEAHRSLAGIYAQLGQRHEEIAYRYRAVVLKPAWATPSNQLILGNALIQLDKMPEAIDCYQRAIRLQPNFYEAYYNLAVAETYRQNWQAAKQAFQQVLKLHPTHAESHYGLGKLAEQAEQLKPAAAYYWRAIQLDSNFAAAYLSLGEILVRLRYWDKALSVCYRAVQLNPDLSWAYYNLGYVLLKQQNWQPAFAALYRALKLNPDFAWTYYYLGQVLLHQKQWDKAITVFLAALQIQLDLSAVYPRLGYALRRQAEKTGLKPMILAYRQAIPLRANYRQPEFYLELANRLARCKQFAAATIFYSLALLHRPQELELRAKAEQMLAAQKQLDQEIADHRRQIEQNPGYHWLCSHLGNLLADQGQLEESVELHQSAIVMRGWRAAAYRNYQFTHDWFTHNISTWETQLKSYVGQPVHGLEVGSFEGMSACWLLDHILSHPQAKLTCIDLFFQESFEANVRLTGSAQKLIKHIGDSHQILARLPSETYDFIYIDGCHLAEHVRRDAELAWRLLKVGGILIFDDYQWIDSSHPGQETHRGIDAFLASTKQELTIIHQDYQVIVRKLKIPRKLIAKSDKPLYPSNSKLDLPLLTHS